MPSLTEVMQRLPKERRKQIEQRTATILADERAKRASDEPTKPCRD